MRKYSTREPSKKKKGTIEKIVEEVEEIGDKFKSKEGEEKALDQAKRYSKKLGDSFRSFVADLRKFRKASKYCKSNHLEGLKISKYDVKADKNQNSWTQAKFILTEKEDLEHRRKVIRVWWDNFFQDIEDFDIAAKKTAEKRRKLWGEGETPDTSDTSDSNETTRSSSSRKQSSLAPDTNQTTRSSSSHKQSSPAPDSESETIPDDNEQATTPKVPKVEYAEHPDYTYT